MICWSLCLRVLESTVVNAHVCFYGPGSNPDQGFLRGNGRQVLGRCWLSELHIYNNI